MPESPRRKRFQIHLSTAIVLMFVAGGIIWANVSEHVRHVHGDKGFQGDYFHIVEYEDGSQTVGGKYVCGWPCEAMQSLLLVADYDLSTRIWTRARTTRYWHAGAIVVNALAALMLLFSGSFLCEWLIRRRTARKDA